MKKLLLVLALLLSLNIYADNPPAVATQMNNARFEVIQNPNVRKYTFYLDKVEGKVYQLVQSYGGRTKWEEMTVYPKDTQTYTEPTYQIYISGLMTSDTFLINTKTGRTWMLVQGRDDEILWEEFY